MDDPLNLFFSAGRSAFQLVLYTKFKCYIFIHQQKYEKLTLNSF